MGAKQKTFDEKRGNPKMQGAQNKRPPMKKRQPPTKAIPQTEN
jgi:hypothetical protein